MPLVAHDGQTGQRIDITLYKNPRVELPTSNIVCPECNSPMVLKAGVIKMAHFAHKPGSNCSYGCGESLEHMTAKRMVATWLRGEMSGCVVEPEYSISNRRADLAQIFPNGWIVVHEIQLASITTEELQKRTDDYMNAGCDVIWYFGKKTSTPANRTWAERFQGQVLVLEFRESANANNTTLRDE